MFVEECVVSGRLLLCGISAVVLSGCAVQRINIAPSSTSTGQHATLRWRTSVERPLKLFEIDDLSAEYPGVKSADYVIAAGPHTLRFLYQQELRLLREQGAYAFKTVMYLQADSLLNVDFTAEPGHTYFVNAILSNHQEPQVVAGEVELRNPGSVDVGVFDFATKVRLAGASLPLRYDTRTKPQE